MRRSFLAALLVLSACPAPEAPAPGAFPNPGTDVVFTVDGEAVTQPMLRAALGRFPEEQVGQLDAAGRTKDLLEQIGLAQALYHRALSQKIQDRPDIIARLAMAQRDVLMEALLKDIAKTAGSDEALAKAYEDHKVQYVQKGAKVRVIFLNDEAKAKETRAMLDAGADFARVAAEISLDKGTGANGGEIGWKSKGELPPVLDGALFDADTVGLIGPIGIGADFVILDVQERRDAIPLEEVKDELKKQVEEEALEKYLDALKAEAKLEWKGEPPTLASLLAAPGTAAPAPADGAPAPAPAPEAAPAPAEAPAPAPAEAPAPAPAH